MIDLLNCVKRVDCPECDASYCQECDFLNQNQGKLHVDHPLPIVFYACSIYHIINLCMYRNTILLCFVVELSPVNAGHGSCSFAMLVDGVGSCIH